MDLEDDDIPRGVLRDLFAAAALMGLQTWFPTRDGEPVSIHRLDTQEAKEDRARFAYAQADAMLAVRDATGRGRIP